jgi:hypothetical protein
MMIVLRPPLPGTPKADALKSPMKANSTHKADAPPTTAFEEEHFCYCDTLKALGCNNDESWSVVDGMAGFNYDAPG